MIKSYTYHATKPGKNVLVFGAVHGDEVCGTRAIERLIQEFEKGDIELCQGSITLVPICNPRAYEKNTRQTEENLNRVFKRHNNPSFYESTLANILTFYVDRCDYLLDLHSTSAGGTPFVFNDYPNDDQTRGLASSTGVEFSVTGWPELYAQKATLSNGDTVGYAHEQKKCGVVLECGAHTEAKAIDLAVEAILGVASFANIIERPLENIRQIEIQVCDVFLYEEKATYTKPWNRLHKINKDEIVAITQSGKKILAPYNGYLIMPKENPRFGEEWFYFGQ